MKQKYPINIAGLTYDIIIKDAQSMGGHIGQADFNAQEIRLNESFTDQTKTIAVYHEIIHILDSVFGLNLTEQQVVIGTHALICFLDNNPNFNVKDILNKLSPQA